MNWEAVSAVGDVFGVLLVIGTLILLIKQISQNTEAIRLQTRVAIADHQMQSIRAPLDSPELLAALSERSGRSPSDTALVSWQRMLLRQWETAHYLYRNGQYDEDEFLAHRETWKTALAMTGMREFWTMVEKSFSEPFRAEINRMISEI